MSRAAGGTYTLPAGNPVVTGTIISSTWGNTTLSDIATALTDSLSRSGLGGMTAPLLIADGTAALPAYSWTNEPSSGFYRIGAGNIGLSVLNRLTWNMTSAGNMTLAAPSSGTTFTVNGLTGANTFILGSTGAAASLNTAWNVILGASWNIFTQSTDPLNIGTTGAATLTLSTNSAARLTANSTGNVTINAPSSGTTLTVAGTSSGGSAFTGGVGTTLVLDKAGSSSTRFRFFVGDGTGGTTADDNYIASNNTTLHFWNGAAGTTETMRIATAGNVTINAPSSGVALVVGGINGQANATIFEGLNSINAQKNAATYETGSFTGTLTGCTTSPTATFNWSRNGNAVTICAAASLNATSNSTACTITGLPANLQPAALRGFVIAAEDNGVTGVTVGSVTTGSGTITLYWGAAFGSSGFTAAGAKGLVSPSTSFTYNLT